ncbi:BatA domain-containing protein [Robertkochia sediminum]|uniref:BatA domain-containing protein n=1 Tax=Robertkochia sediminum TaxID=2785326 RepID=UPI00193232B3|nr:BatA domain-containing protein [Robertkochia sediminum]MBL7473463.1 BatA and WFA domain-containing protein [Robertkochia sediminum]
MHLKHPEILWALFLLIIPLIVHLFRLRRFKKESFTNVRFLKEVELQTRKSSSLKKWLVLLTRMLALAFLIFAFTGPYSGDPEAGKDNTAYIVYIDNSQSMSFPSAQGTLLQKAVNTLVDQWPEDIEILVITNNSTIGPGTKNSLRNQLLTLEYSSAQLGLDEVILKAKTLFPDQQKNKVIYLLTDLQRTQQSLPEVSAEDLITRLTVVRADTPSNIAIDSLSIGQTTPESTRLTVFLSHAEGVSPENLPVSVLSGNELLARAPAVFETDTTRVTFDLPPADLARARISIKDNGLPYDNELYFSLPVSEKINILHISEAPGDYLNRIFTEDEFRYITADPNAVDYNVLSEQNLVILDQVRSLPPALGQSLSDLADRGLRILQIPATNEASESFYQLNAQLGLPRRDSLVRRSAVVSTIRYDHPLFKNVFNERVSNFQYPNVSEYYALSGPVSAALELAGGLPFLYGKNGHYAFTTAVNSETTDLIQSALVVPVFYAIGLQSMRLPRSYYTFGNQESADIRTTLQKDQILALDNGITSVIPRQEAYGNYVRVYPDEQITSPGHYRIIKENETIGNISFNEPRTESQLEYHDPEAFKNITAYSSIDEGLEQVKSENKVNELWKWFVIFAIAFFLTEMLILKYFK